MKMGDGVDAKGAKLFVLCVLVVFAGILNQPSLTHASTPILKMAFIEAASMTEVRELGRLGIDIIAVRREKAFAGDPQAACPYRAEAVISKTDEAKLTEAGFTWSEPKTIKRSRSAGDETAYHSFDEPVKGIKDRLSSIAARCPDLVTLKTIGFSIENRPIIALGIGPAVEPENGKADAISAASDKAIEAGPGTGTGKGALSGILKRAETETGAPAEGPTPEILFVATHHAREWVATQTAMRLITWLVEGYGVNERVTALLAFTRVWIIPVANPDGYEYTFTHERLWRKNLRDNDGDGEITAGDGVDLNRNFDFRWGYDDAGSSGDPFSHEYRGTAPHSEPENLALVEFIRNRNFRFLISYHSYGNLILYPWGWQLKTPSADDPLFVALAGTDDAPAIWDSIIGEAYDPGVAADQYVTNGEFTDWGYGGAGIPTFVVELTSGVDGDDNFYGFVFPDDGDMLDAVFNDNLEFALSCMESAADPRSSVGIEQGAVYHTPPTASMGISQLVEVTAANGQAPELRFRINGGPMKKAAFAVRPGSIYNTGPGLWFSRYQALITGQGQGDRVAYSIVTQGGGSSGPWEYFVAGAGDKPVLVIAEGAGASDGSCGVSEGPACYTEALEGAGYAYDIHHVEEAGEMPSYAAVLSHYDAVVWYVGDHYDPAAAGGDAREEGILGLREFINHGGRLLAVGRGLPGKLAGDGGVADEFLLHYLGVDGDMEEDGLTLPGGGIYPVAGRTDHTLYPGFGFEEVETPELRGALMGTIMGDFGLVPGPDFPWEPRIAARNEEGRLLVEIGLGSATVREGVSDWWIHAETPFGIHSWVYPGGWVEGERRTLVHAPLSFSGFNILDAPVPDGSYVFHFALDDNSDGIMDRTRHSSAVISVGQGLSPVPVE